MEGDALGTFRSDDVYLDEPWLTIRWDGEHKCVYSEWTGFTTSAEFRTATMKMLEAIRYNQAAAMVSDTRRLEGIAIEDQMWVRDTWVPQAVAAGLKRIAVVVAYHGLAKFAMEEVRVQVGDRHFTTGTFASPDEAVKWVAGHEKASRLDSQRDK